MASARTIACFGDSLTEGFGLVTKHALPAVLEGLLREQGYDVTCRNMGVSGETSEDGLRRIKPVLKLKPCVCIVAFGANDFFLGTEPGETEANLAAMLDGLKACNIAPILAGVACFPEFGDEYKKQFDAVFPELARRYAIPLLPDLLGTYLHDPDNTLIDQLHPNEQGVRNMARALAPIAAKVLDETA
ncbi:acyl-CoA thioesterase-1 [Paucidesulfovibrio gracilis DSM 16080]|uniref:Acyl-CoA thioesterase-1 n=1 Tax=Paucidesulfovibrio gracilis DSM 16080 TaxID=1121449 RepID=A0A1T4WR15_9BACT|nr:arylesterase [Paucidesulfovibrio gracilis]SKA79783.1 acyl-CoA thioesterase-1 [Paucidesulfovibrio gracilis DSM 16080]